jgi:hypothetical protein
VQLTEIPANTIPNFYKVTKEGTIAESQAPQVQSSVEASSLTAYSLKFKVKVLVGGFGFTVLSDTLNSGIYISFDLVTRKISMHHGSTTINPLLAEFDLPANLTCSSDCWHQLDVEAALTDIVVTMDGVSVLKASQTSSFFGSFGFGASFGHRALFRDLSASSTDGRFTYANDLTDSAFLKDFYSGSNPHATVVDGSRRDRIAYTGDLDVASGAALVSTHNIESLIGSMNLLGSFQTTPGFFIPTAKIQQEPRTTKLDINITGLIGYSFNFLTALASTYMHTGDAEFAARWAPSVRSMLDWAHSQTLENGLFNVSQASFGGDWNYYDPPQSGIVTKFNVVYAYALQECARILSDGGVDCSVYSQRLDDLRTAIDDNLWSSTLNAYFVSDDLKNAFAQDANALAILAGVNRRPDHSTDTILQSLDTLFTPAGPLAFSSAALSAGFQPYISPYASAYHLRAAAVSNNTEAFMKLLGQLWEPMANVHNENYTGAFWETLDRNGRPGLGLSTSLCHGWAAGPTAELTHLVLGAVPQTPGWRTFRIAPSTLGLAYARGRVPTPNGAVEVDWRFDQDNMLTMTVQAPTGTKGTVYLPRPLLQSDEDTVFKVNGKVQTEPFSIEGGREIMIKQTRY